MSETIFFNVWNTKSKEQQKALLNTMRKETPALQAKSGFLSLTAWVGEGDDLRVIVQGCWASQEAFEAAVANDPRAQESRHQMAAFGTPEPGLFTQSFNLKALYAEEEVTVPTKNSPSQDFSITKNDLAVNGQTIHYLRAGSGPALVLVHGYPESSETWRKVIPELAQNFTVLAPDTRGVGASSLARHFSVQDVADDIYELVRALGFQQVILVGQDFGVQIVSAYAAQHREDVRALVVIESPLTGFGLEDLFASFWHFGFLTSPFAEMLITGREREFFKAFAFGDFVYQKGAFTPADIDKYVANQTRPERLAAGLDYYRTLILAREFFEKTVRPPWTFPVLAIDGDHSMNSLTAESFRRVQPQLQSLIAPECGHFVQEEQPAFLVHAISEFLQRI